MISNTIPFDQKLYSVRYLFLSVTETYLIVSNAVYLRKVHMLCSFWVSWDVTVAYVSVVDSVVHKYILTDFLLIHQLLKKSVETFTMIMHISIFVYFFA